MNHLDLFSGIGGFSLAAQWVWGEDHNIVAFCEIDKFCQKVLGKHWPDVPIHDDIRTWGHDGKKIDLITGGPPCQYTSVAAAITGKRTGYTMWPDMERIIRVVRPKWVIVEQPAGNKRWEDQVEISLENLDYTIAKFKRQAVYCGAPHSRKRVFIVADTNRKRLHQIARLRESLPAAKKSWPAPPRGTWRSARTGNCGVDDGLSDFVDRLKSLGNAIVPQVVVPIMQAIKQLEVGFGG